MIYPFKTEVVLLLTPIMQTISEVHC